MSETDDVRKLLEERKCELPLCIHFTESLPCLGRYWCQCLPNPEELSASSAPVAAPKVNAGPVKKKKRGTRALKITNTHMKEQVSGPWWLFLGIVSKY